ncbi:MAG: hypothetical protein ACLFTT_13265 [Candidatus Hydrogenedentota bacterium]
MFIGGNFVPHDFGDNTAEHLPHDAVDETALIAFAPWLHGAYISGMGMG